MTNDDSDCEDCAVEAFPAHIDVAALIRKKLVPATKRTMYNFVLWDQDLDAIFTTSLEEPDPTLDAQFFQRFLEQDVYMSFNGTTEEPIAD